MVTRAIKIVLILTMFAGCSGTLKNVCETTCNKDYNYYYKFEYDSVGRLVDISSSTRFSMDFDNGSRVKRIDTAPEAATGVLRSAWDQVTKLIGGIAGSIF